MKKLLLDTHTFIWWVDDSPRLSTKAKDTIADIHNECYLSLVSCWEIAIKCNIGKLQLTLPVKEYIPQNMAVNGFKQLALSFRHVAGIENLPLHHRDPFDRLLAVQTQKEQMIIVSADVAFDPYGVERLW